MDKRVNLKPSLGQFFLEDQEFFLKIIDLTAIQSNEVVLEIGAGDGRLTKLLAKKAQKVIAIEIDKRFLPNLKRLPKNVEIVIGDALKFFSLKKIRKFDKIVANLPSNLVEPLFHRLTSINFKLAIFLVPEKFAYKLIGNPIFTAYFEIKLIAKVPKKSFFPVPRTNWEMISLRKLADPLKTSKTELFLIRFIYEHPMAKIKNSLMEGIIKFFSSKGKKLSKNQARQIIAKAKIKKEILESLPINSKVYSKVAKVVATLFSPIGTKFF